MRLQGGDLLRHVLTVDLERAAGDGDVAVELTGEYAAAAVDADVLRALAIDAGAGLAEAIDADSVAVRPARDAFAHGEFGVEGAVPDLIVRMAHQRASLFARDRSTP